MRFYSNHFNKHHLFHAPHLWFFALLSSPIHFAELHYKRRYHLNFEHAKKLFVFDLTLLFSIIILIITTIFWFTYNPTVTNLVYLNIRPSFTRVASGEYVTYVFHYKNSSTITLRDPQLKLKLPVGFILDQAEPQEVFNSYIFTLPDLSSGADGLVTVSGWLFGTPEKEDHISATLSYRQEGRRVSEEKSSLLIKVLRGSVLQTEIQAPSIIIANQSANLKLILKNNGQKALTQIRLPLSQASALLPISTSASLGVIENNIWQIEYLEPGAMANLELELKNEGSGFPQKLTALFIPSITVNHTTIPQATLEHNFSVAYPNATITSAWQNNQNTVQPNNVATLLVNLKNTSNIDLTDGQISLSFPSAVVDTARLAQLNLGAWKNQTWTISARELPGLLEIKPQEEISYNLQIPIIFLPQGGDDLILRPEINFSSGVNRLPNSSFTVSTSATDLKVGTQIIFNPEVRYYTKEGDQLGRGPLPPQIGKETKYWVFVPINNSTSKIKDLKFSASLPNYITWTGKTSVSHGNNPTYDSAQKKISWSLGSLASHSQAGIYFELALTPTSEQSGTSPILIKELNFSATDLYTEAKIQKTAPDLDITLPNDERGNSYGTKVVE